MSNCENYVSEEDIRALKESEQHIEHVARSHDSAGSKALYVTDIIRGGSVTNRTLDGLEKLYTDKIESLGHQQMGDYTTGINVTARDQIVFYDGSWYMYRGDLPHVTAGETLPDDGGIWSEANTDGLWVDVGDVSLRGDLKNGDGSLIGVGSGTLNDAIKYVTPEMFGAVPWKSDNIKSTDFVDSYQNLQDMFDSGLPVQMTARYVTSRPILIPENTKITGSGSEKCGIFKSTNNASGLGSYPPPSGVGSISYNVDAVLIVKRKTQGYAYNIDWSGFRVSKCGLAYQDGNKNYNGIGIFAPYFSKSTWKDIVSFGFKTPMYNINSWMNNFTRVHMHGHEGFILGGRGGEPDEGGTTSTLSNCWSSATSEGYYPWNFNNMWQAQMIGCAAEYIGDETAAAEGIINAVDSYVIIDGIDIEKSHIKRFIRNRRSVVDITGVNTVNSAAKYANKDTYLFDIEWGRTILRSGNVFFARDSVNTAKNSNFATVVGSSAYLKIESAIIVPQVTEIKRGGYISADNDFIIYASLNAAVEILSNAENADGRTKRIISESTSFLIPPLMKNYEEYVDGNRLRVTSYPVVFAGREAINTGVNGSGTYILNLTNGNESSLNNNSVQMAFNVNATQVKFRGALWGGAFSTWREFLTTVNTTTDGNGFVKKASPIVKIFADRIECNEESKGVEMEHLGVGHYLIKGVVGFNADGAWGINNGFVIPQDNNCKNMVLIDYDVKPDGNIELFVFHNQNIDMPERFQNKRIKHFDEEGQPVYFDNYEPCDVPESRWMDMRVEMPPNSIYNQKQAEAVGKF